MTILVSACILGDCCRYDGGNNYNEVVARCMEGHKVIKVCPQVLIGMPTPRKRVEFVEMFPVDSDGEDVCMDYQFAADMAVGVAREENIDLAILQSKSSMCGVNNIHDGFSEKIVEGGGLFAEGLILEGYNVMDVEDFNEEDFKVGIFKCKQVEWRKDDESMVWKEEKTDWML